MGLPTGATRLPRPLRRAGIAAAALGLTLAFAFVLFPYERLARAISERSVALSGVQLDLARLGPTFGLRGPGLAARDVRATLPDGRVEQLARVAVHPALSSAWLRGRPALYLDVDGGTLGALRGTLVVGRDGGFDGRVERLALERLPFERLSPGLSLAGRLDAEVSLRRDPDRRLEGRIAFVARDGSFGAPALPIAIPFDTLEGRLDLGGEVFAHVEALSLTGPMLEATARGDVEHGPRGGEPQLALQLELQARGQPVRQALASLGIRTGRDGRARLRLGGPLSSPTYR